MFALPAIVAALQLVLIRFGGFEHERYWYRDYCAYKLLTSADDEIIFPNKINIRNLKEIDLKFIKKKW